MPASNQRYIVGERFWLAYKGLTKEEANKRAAKLRSGGYSARVERITRGNYKVWTTKPFAYLDK